MTKTTIALGLTTIFVLTGAAQVTAQAPPSPINVGFIAVHVGAQPQRPTIRTSDSFSLYDETATVASVHSLPNGPMLDVAGGYRVGRRLLLGAGVSVFRSSGASTVTASIPDPGFFDRPRSVAAAASGLERSELGMHVQIGWPVPVTDKIDVLLSAGPSFIRLTQELTPTVTVPARTQNITVVRERQSGTALGINAGVDGTFMLSPRYGAGVFVRYAGGSVDLPAVPDVSVGGFQTGFGVHVRF